MAIISIGTTTASVFYDGRVYASTINNSFLPVNSPPTVVAPHVNYTTGTHTFTVNVGSVLHLLDTFQNNPIFNSGFMATAGNAVWTVQVLGTVHAFNSYTDVDNFTVGNGAGISLLNGAASLASTITVGAEGSVYGNGYGIVSATAMTITNAGLIGGGDTGIMATSEVNGLSNLNLTAAGVAQTITVTNGATGEIFGEVNGIQNNSESNLVINNSGFIIGGKTRLTLDSDGYIDYDTSYFANAVITWGRLTLTNTATGMIDGDVLSSWTNSAVTNQGIITGTVTAYVDDWYIQYEEDLPAGAVPKLDANRDGDFTDVGDLAITSSTLVGMTLINSGVINGNKDYLTYDVQIVGDDPDLPPETVTITQKVAFDGSVLRDVITNTATGLIYGDVLTLYGNDSFTNAGRLNGAVDMGDGNDVVANSGTIVGFLNTANGNDSFINSGVLYNAAELGNGNDVFTNAASGSIILVESQENFDRGFIAIDMGDGNDTITAAGTLKGGVELGAGNDSMSLAGGMTGDFWADQFDGGAPSATGDGSDRFSISTAGRVNGSVYLGAGNNSLTNAGILTGPLLLIGDREIDDAVIYALVVALGGNDTLTNAATGTITGGIDLGDGTNTITNAGRIYNSIDGAVAVTTGSGSDTFNNTGTIGSQLPLFAYNSRSTSTNLFADLRNSDNNPPVAVSMGGGADVLINTGAPATGGIFGVIFMGEGADTVRGGASSEFIFDEAGADQYLLGAGADAFVILQPDADIDLFDGSTGLDLIMFEVGLDDSAIFGHRIDLTTGAVIYNVEDYFDRTAGDGTANDIVRNVEQVYGSAGDDVIIGSSAADTLSGGSGDDTVRGGLGRDVLYGEIGADVFVFELATDSGRTRATRDLIADFSQEDGDQIWLNFDSNTRAGTGGANSTNEFVFMGNNTAFTGNGGGDLGEELFAQVRTISQAGLTVVEVDTNGDRQADFSFALTGSHTLAVGDFYVSNVLLV